MSTMPNRTDHLIDALVTELTPVKRMTRAAGLFRLAAGLIVAVAIAAFGAGLRPDLRAWSPDPVLVLTSGPFLLLACAAGLGAVRMSRPQVGSQPTGWPWAAAMAALLPASALLTWGVAAANGSPMEIDREGWVCTAMGIVLGLFMAAALTLWLRRGAPTSPERAGLLIGTASASAGIFAFSLHCPHNDIGHIGLWHALAVLLGAIAGRWIVPAFVRW